MVSIRLVIEKRASVWHWSLKAMKIQFFENSNSAQAGIYKKKNAKFILR